MIDTWETIRTCVDYIEARLHAKITLDDIAGHTGISKYYLHRMFRALTGEAIIEYVQARKLTASLHELFHTKMRMVDIAMEYGFEHEQSYIRAFKKRFGYTPFRVRSGPVSLGIREKINPADILTVSNSVTYKPFYVYRPMFNLVGCRHKILSKSGANAANAYGRDFFYNLRSQVPNTTDPPVYYGYTDWSGYEDGYIYYMPSVQVPDLTAVPVAMTGVTIPAHKYVVFRFVGFFHPDEINGRQVGRLLVHLYRRWITNSGYRSADRFRFEYIDSSLVNDNYCELDIYQPIEEIDWVVGG
jgi:AraC family transcriptional regulator